MTGPRRRDGVASREVDGDVVLWDGDALHLLDPRAAAVWLLLDGRRSGPDVCRVLAQRFAADAAQLEADVAGLLAWFAERGLLADDGQYGDSLPK
ncbi:MAG TPA: PqqD family protein [Mycobacteriales bacterium]|nr:PqqD family protein [Mycobacteriales bacterium]